MDGVNIMRHMITPLDGWCRSVLGEPSWKLSVTLKSCCSTRRAPWLLLQQVLCGTARRTATVVHLLIPALRSRSILAIMPVCAQKVLFVGISDAQVCESTRTVAMHLMKAL